MASGCTITAGYYYDTKVTDIHLYLCFNQLLNPTTSLTSIL